MHMFFLILFFLFKSRLSLARELYKRIFVTSAITCILGKKVEVKLSKIPISSKNPTLFDVNFDSMDNLQLTLGTAMIEAG